MAERPTRRAFLASSAALAAGVSLRSAAAAPADPAPPRCNIIFVLIDDQRFDALGCLGHPFLQTPHIDALAKDGVIFENAFVTNSLCSPSRASILTGTYAHRHRVMDNVTPTPADLATFPALLHDAGYTTAYIGKWHMGGESDAPQPGFDHWVSFRGQGIYRNPMFNVNGKREQQNGYMTDLLTDRAEEFLRRPHEKPFFMYLAHKAVHAEFDAADRHKGCYAKADYPHPASMADTEENYRGKPAWVRAQRNSWHGVDGMYNKTTDFDTFVRDYAETMRAVDDSVGRIVTALRETGKLDSTLIVYTSDNGFQFGEHGLIDKRTMYEASIRVPLIVHCPLLAKGGQRRKEMALNIDLAPTLLDAAGVSIPAAMQGRSFLPLFKDDGAAWRDAFLYTYFWERSFPQTPTVLGVRTDRYKFMKYQGIWDRYELYDLQEDPNEMRNLLGDFIVQTEGGPLDAVIRKTAPPETRELFNRMDKRLRELLIETGCREEPSWTS